MYLFSGFAIYMLISLCLGFYLDLRLFPVFYTHNSLMKSINHKKIIFLHQMIFITGSMNLFGTAATISYLSAIDRILKYISDKCRIE